MKIAFDQPAAANATITDKVTAHGYERIYARFLVPLAAAARATGRRVKLLETGLGCNVPSRSPGASAKLWARLFPRRNTELWMAEFDGKCARALAPELERLGVRVLIGDQADPKVDARTAAQSQPRSVPALTTAHPPPARSHHHCMCVFALHSPLPVGVCAGRVRCVCVCVCVCV